MKTTQKIITIVITMVIAVFFIAGNTNAQAKKPWDIPAAAKSAKSTVNLKDAGTISNGKDLWAKHCKSCHGSKGLGDGPKAASLKTNPGDFTAAAFQGQSDGDLFFETSKGRDEMPAYEKKIPEANDRWALVAFMRTLKK
ncbi:MAG: cytochrome c [Bacteroidota bacterium]